MPAAGAIASVVTGVIGAKSSSGASKRASEAAAKSESAQLAYLREKDAAEARQADPNIEGSRAWREQKNFEAQQDFERRRWEAEEEERMYKRRLFEEDRQAEVDARNARAAADAAYVDPGPAPEDPYVTQRKQLRDQAMQSVGQLLSSGYARKTGYAAPSAPGGQPLTTAQFLQLQAQGRR